MGGGSGGGAGGGGSSGKVDFPDYMKAAHKTIVGGFDQDFDNFTGPPYGAVWSAVDARDNNPYTGIEAYDPASNISTTQARFNSYAAILDAINPENLWNQYKDTIRTDLDIEDLDWEEIVELIKAKYDDSIASEEYIQEKISSFETSQNAVRLSVDTRFSGYMADIGGVMSSAFVLGSSMLEQERIRNLAEFEANLRYENYKIRIQFIQQSVRDFILCAYTKLDYVDKGMGELISLLNMQLQYQHSSSQLQGELSRLAIISLSNQTDRDAELDDSEGRWEMECWQYAANVLGAIGGGTAVYNTKGSNKSGGGGSLMSALSGAASGAGLAAAMGAGSGGMAAGAGLGALAAIAA